MTAPSVSSCHVSALSCCEANSTGDWILTRSQRESLRPSSRNCSNVPEKQSSTGGRGHAGLVRLALEVPEGLERVLGGGGLHGPLRQPHRRVVINQRVVELRDGRADRLLVARETLRHSGALLRKASTSDRVSTRNGHRLAERHGSACAPVQGHSKPPPFVPSACVPARQQQEI
eukprot:5234316-Pleurochrysis_carterae.AAC.13